jgi:UDP-N-acetylglucosamine/UDP-N-acetylgalactosamine 4-epimerase
MKSYEQIKSYLLYNQKTWLITGVAGFIGSNLAETLLQLNQKVVSIDNLSTGHKQNISYIKSSVSSRQWENFSFLEEDITNYSACKSISRNVDIILHQAALGSVPRSICNPIDSNNSNVTGFLNILNAAQENGIKRLVYASSSSVYGDSQELPKREHKTGKLLSPYAVTKYVNELYAEVFNKCFKIETIGLRYFNVFGKRQDPNGAYAAVIPRWICQIIKESDVYINGDGETSRDFTYIENVIQANIIAGMTTNTTTFGETFNIAAGGRETLNNLYTSLVIELQKSLPNSNLQSKKPTYTDFRPGDIRHSNANINKAKDMLGYLPTHTLNQGLTKSIQWYINDFKGRH